MSKDKEMARKAADYAVNRLQPDDREMYGPGGIYTMCGFAEDVLHHYYDEFGEDSQPTQRQLNEIAEDIV